MSQVSLFRKWRSQAFGDLVGQEAVTRTLRNVLSGGSPARAYLFCGPRGTGKTSTARIFAKALCCESPQGLEPCNACSICREIAVGSCMDVFEIDAASNTQVDKIRDFIVDKVHFAPARAKFKVYIIDEVHKLSTSSFNALLKTLEEPPPHVVFVLATTHPHEVLPTIVSRCQRYDFRAFSLRELETHLLHVASSEKLGLDADGAQTLARAAQGSMRDALVLLEQAHQFCGDQINVASLTEMLGLLPQETLAEWVDALKSGQAATLLDAVESMHRNGQDFVRVIDLWVDHLRLLMVAKVQGEGGAIAELTESYRSSLLAQAAGLHLSQVLAWLRAAIELHGAVREGQSPRVALELCLVSLCGASGAPSLEILARQLQELREQISSGQAGAAPTSPAPAGVAAPVEAARLPEPSRPAAAPFKAPDLSRAAAEPPARPEPARPAAPLGAPEPFQLPPHLAHRRGEEAAPSPRPRSEPFAEPPARREERPPQAERAPEKARSADPAPVGNAQDKQFWPSFLEQVRQRDKRLLAVLNDARFKGVQDNQLTVTLPATHTWHRDKLVEGRVLLEEVLATMLQSKVQFNVMADGDQVNPPQDQEHESLVSKAKGLFGGVIVTAAKDRAE